MIIIPSESKLSAISAQIPTLINSAKNVNNWNHQNSERVARPEKVQYFSTKHVFTASTNYIIFMIFFAYSLSDFRHTPLVNYLIRY